MFGTLMQLCTPHVLHVSGRTISLYHTIMLSFGRPLAAITSTTIATAASTIATITPTGKER
ncbi:hypothetical protein AA15669_1234 [Saccharibacter floricola DSM 15669]|uniref:Uncharacterized protein n=1 Tax=Saccharibacter floricola DSM 15669 TaxID=1123227 RepID=A0ABQ0P004_9PROT|nr:hypothetical protein AA15669_1234 [Saccharibacter floricola DSM 15669]